MLRACAVLAYACICIHALQQGIYCAPGPSRSIDDLRLYGVLSQTIVLCSPNGTRDDSETGAEREGLQARARRYEIKMV